MEQLEIDQLMKCKDMQQNNAEPTLIQTHISWVILTDKYAYKIKKPIDFKFLDFSSLEKRKFYCEREVELNKRLAVEMYLKTIVIYKEHNAFSINSYRGEIVDYAVLMKKMDTTREMDKMLLNHEIRAEHIEKLAKKIAAFHQEASIIPGTIEVDAIKRRFNEIEEISKQVTSPKIVSYQTMICEAVKKSNQFLDQHRYLLNERALNGKVRDVHGDLHMGNIFLYDDPVIFDCIEFNDQLRYMDILDEIAFLCMDLEAHGRNDLSELFYSAYLKYSENEEDAASALLLKYFKFYRASIRAKVYMLHAMEITRLIQFNEKIVASERYLNVLERYISEF